MANNTENQAFAVDVNKLPDNWPTNFHNDEFWSALGRTIATFGALENTLAKAIASFSGTIKYEEDEVEQEYEKWKQKLEKALSDPLGSLISAFEKEVKNHPETCISNPHDLIADLRKAVKLRNVLCHGFWGKPDKDGKTIPSFYTRSQPEKKLQVLDTPIDIEYLEQTRKHVVELICAVVTTVTSMGYQFPGSDGPGEPVS
ncbi:MAG: hypothetical protein JKY46_09350 [Robiginitomaculum sp.]|nr:hypothetical protein [Robiginitomaculum sp.]